MADDVVGGLEQASPYEKAQAKYQEQIEKLAKIQENLMASLDTRQGAGNPLLALASGFLAPTRGGGFGESAGNALQAMGAQQQLEEKQIKENAMMRMQLAQQSLTPYKEQMELARRASMAKDLKNILSGGEQSQQINGPQAAQIARSAGVAPFSDEAASIIGKNMPAAGENIFSRIDPSTKGLLMSQASVDPEGVMKELATYGMKESGRTDKMKEMEYYANQFPGADRSRLMQFAASRQLIGDPSALITSLKSVQEMIDQGIDIPTNQAAKAFLLKQLEHYGMPQQGVTPKPELTSTAPSPVYSASPAGFPKVLPSVQAERDEKRMRLLKQELAFAQQKLNSQNPDIRSRAQSDIDSINYEINQTNSRIPAEKPVEPPENLNKSQRELKQRQAQEVQTARNKAAEAERNKVYANFNQASQDRLASADVTAMVNKSPNMFGVFERPDFGSAIGGIIENALNVGRFSIGMPGIRAAVSKLGARDQQDIDNMQRVAAVAVNSSLSLAAAAKGSVSNFERELFQQASLSTHDTPNVLLYKADLLKARANFYTVMWDDFRNFEKKNPSATFSDYQDTAGKNLLSRYEAQLAKIRDNYIR